MFKKLLSLAAVALLAISTFATSDIGTNTPYYIKNVESGLFLCGANNWGTKGSVSVQGNIFQLEEGDNGTYYLVDTDLSSNVKKLGDNLFTDNAGCEWTITQVESGIFTISNASGYIAQSATAGYHIGFVLEQVQSVTNAAKWQFLTEDEAKATLDVASQYSPVDASFFIRDANFSRNHATTSWTVTASNKNLSGGDDGNRCAESYESTFDIYQTLSGIPNGVYELTAQAALSERTGKYDGTDYPVVYAKDATQPFQSMETSDRYTNMGKLSNAFTNGQYPVGPVKATVTDNTLTIGVKGTRTDTWCIWDNFQLKYYGVDMTALQEAWATAKETAQTALNVYDETYAATERAAVIDAMYANPITADDYNAAISSLTNATTAYVAQAEYEKRIADKSGLTNFINNISDTYPYSSTTLFPADLTAWDNSTYVANTAGEQHWSGVKTTYYEQSGAQYWLSQWSIAATKTVSLPKGKYAFVVTARASVGCTSTMTVDGVEVVLSNVGPVGYGVTTDGTASYDKNSTYADNNNGRGWEYAYAAFEVTDDTKDVTISFAASAAVQKSWVSVSNLALYFDETANNALELIAAKAALKEALDAHPTVDEHIGTDVFEYNQEEATVYNNTIAAAKEVYDNGNATKEEVEAHTAALDALTLPSLNAPSPTQAYKIILKYDGWTYNNCAITSEAGARSDCGGYNVQYIAQNPNYAQAMYFTKVEGENNYTISWTDADGATRYLCTGVPYGGTNLAIRTTTVKEDALVIKVSRDGDYINLYNTVAGEYLGSQDAGVYTVHSHNTFTVEETDSTNDISITVKERRYAAICLPYNATADSAYTIESVEEEEGGAIKVVLAKVNTLEAGKAYILANGTYNFSGVNVVYQAPSPAKVKFRSGSKSVSNEAISFDFLGVFKETTVPVGSYVLQTNIEEHTQQFSLVKEGAQPTLLANEAYLKLNKVVADTSLSLGGKNLPYIPYPANNLYVCGTFNNWTPSDVSYKMTETVTGSKWTYDFGANELVGQYFKINDGSWDGSYNLGSSDSLKEGTISLENSNLSGNIYVDSQYSSATNVVITLSKDAEGNFTLTAAGTFAGKLITGITTESYKGIYDAQAHSLTVNGTVAGDSVTYSTDSVNWVASFDRTDVSETKVFVKVARANYNDYVTSDSIVISKRAITMTSASAEKSYDGEALTKDEVTVAGDGFVEGENATYTVTGSQTKAGSSQNLFTYTLTGATAKAENYKVDTVYGTLTVTAANISGSTSIEPIGNQTYTGDSIKPDVIVWYNGIKLVKDSDYTVVYSNNVNVGQATATITGKGNYTGSDAIDFTIEASLYVCGTVNNWTLLDASYKMTETVTGSVWTFDFGAAELVGQNFKINDGSWEGSYNLGSSEGLKEGTINIVNSNQSSNIYVDSKYSSVTNVVITLSKDAEGNFTLTAAGTFIEGEKTIPDLYLRGINGSWNATDANKFTKSEDSDEWKLTLDVTATNSFKVADANYGDYNFGGDGITAVVPGTDYTLVNGSQSNNLWLENTPTEGNYTFTVVKDGDNWTLKVTDNTATDLDETQSQVQTVKFFRNGLLYIQRNGVLYDAQGHSVE